MNQKGDQYFGSKSSSSSKSQSQIIYWADNFRQDPHSSNNLSLDCNYHENSINLNDEQQFPMSPLGILFKYYVSLLLIFAEFLFLIILIMIL